MSSNPLFLQPRSPRWIAKRPKLSVVPYRFTGPAQKAWIKAYRCPEAYKTIDAWCGHNGHTELASALTHFYQQLRFVCMAEVAAGRLPRVHVDAAFTLIKSRLTRPCRRQLARRRLVNRHAHHLGSCGLLTRQGPWLSIVDPSERGHKIGDLAGQNDTTQDTGDLAGKCSFAGQFAREVQNRPKFSGTLLKVLEGRSKKARGSWRAQPRSGGGRFGSRRRADEQISNQSANTAVLTGLVTEKNKGRPMQPFDAKAFVEAMHRRCRQMRSEAEDAALIAEAERGSQAREVARRRRQLVEQARDADARRRAQLERAEASEQSALANDLVEVRVAPGVPWSPSWFYDVIAHRVPDLEPRALDRTLGCNALLFAVERLEAQQARGRAHRNPAGWVVEEAQAVMRGKRTSWVGRQVAEAQPQLIVTDRKQTYAGKLGESWAAHQQALVEQPHLRRARGLLPAGEGDGG